MRKADIPDDVEKEPSSFVRVPHIPIQDIELEASARPFRQQRWSITKLE